MLIGNHRTFAESESDHITDRLQRLDNTEHDKTEKLVSRSFSDSAMKADIGGAELFRAQLWLLLNLQLIFQAGSNRALGKVAIEDAQGGLKAVAVTAHFEVNGTDQPSSTRNTSWTGKTNFKLLDPSNGDSIRFCVTAVEKTGYANTTPLEACTAVAAW